MSNLTEKKTSIAFESMTGNGQKLIRGFGMQLKSVDAGEQRIRAGQKRTTLLLEQSSLAQWFACHVSRAQGLTRTPIMMTTISHCR
jgi:hypothetical protein